MEQFTIVSVTPENLSKEGIFCIKNPKHPGYRKKTAWFVERYEEGLRLEIIRNEAGKPACFIEYVPAEFAWRPVHAPNYLFVHCLYGPYKEHTGKGNASTLLEQCKETAKREGKYGVAVMTSPGSWLAERTVFEKNGFREVAQRGRYELLVHKTDESAPDPQLLDWTEQQQIYHSGWHLVYADQCPMHDKSAQDLFAYAAEQGIHLQLTKLSTAAEAQMAPSGFGVYSLLLNGQLLEDHYISKGRFKNILQKQLGH